MSKRETASFRLPNGMCTRSARRYIRVWRALGREVAALVGGRCVAFDPGLSIRVGDAIWTCPLWLAQALLKHNQIYDSGYFDKDGCR